MYASSGKNKDSGQFLLTYFSFFCVLVFQPLQILDTGVQNKIFHILYIRTNTFTQGIKVFSHLLIILKSQKEDVRVYRYALNDFAFFFHIFFLCPKLNEICYEHMCVCGFIGGCSQFLINFAGDEALLQSDHSAPYIYVYESYTSSRIEFLMLCQLQL